LIEAENRIARLEDQKNLAVLDFRFDEVMLAMVYNEKLFNAHEEHMQRLEGAKVKHDKECGRLQTETVLDEMIQECLPSKPSDDHSIDTREFVRETLREWIRIGQFFLRLIAEFGWGAMIMPGLSIKQDE
jgi:hypothetical protein